MRYVKDWFISIPALSIIMISTFATELQSADFDLRSAPSDTAVIVIDGEIVEGDSIKFDAIARQAIKRAGADGILIALNSPGGDMHEAMKIGRTVREILAGTITISASVFPRSSEKEFRWAYNPPWLRLAFSDPHEYLPDLPKCWSACTLIWMSGVSRRAIDNEDARSNNPSQIETIPTIGVHRPKPTSPKFGGLSPGAAQSAYNEMLEEMSGFLSDMGASSEFIQISMSVDSSDIRLISKDEIDKLILSHEPFLGEWLRIRCGEGSDILTAEEKSLYHQYDSFMEEFYDRLTWESVPVDSFDKEIDIFLVGKFGIEGTLRVKDIVDRVSRLEWWIDICRDVSIGTVRYEWSLKDD